MVVLKNGHSSLSLGILKSALSQEWIDEMSWFLHANTDLGKLKVT